MNLKPQDLKLTQSRNYPLRRFIPDYSKDVVQDWVSRRSETGSWIFDPFCSNPLLPVDLANEKYRIFACCNNPVINVILQALALALPEGKIRDILSQFGNEKRGDSTLKEYLLSQYTTTCSTCHSQVIVSRYLWTREPLKMIRKVFYCQTCGVNREEDVSAEDHQLFEEITRQSLPATWAINRLGVVVGGENSVLQGALALYTPRAIVSIFALINRLEAMRPDDETKSILRGLIICGCDGGTGFWNESGETPSLRQMIKPSEFLEYNIWQFMENSVASFTCNHNSTPVCEFPELPARNGICIFNGRARSSMPLPEIV